MVTKRESIFNIIDKVDNLPTLPKVVEKLITELNDSKATVENLAKHIGADTSLVSKIFKLVNSAYYGFPRRISTISQAVIFLGFNTLRNIILTATIFDLFENNHINSKIDRRKLWEHSLGSAVISKILCKYLRCGLPEEVFFAGLVHDIGKIVLDQYYHDAFIKIGTKMQKKNISFCRAEMDILNITHSQIGKWLCEKWNFPLVFRDAVEFHHTPVLAKSNLKTICIVHLANTLAKIEKFGFSLEDNPSEIALECYEILGISQEKLAELKPEFHEDFEKVNFLLDRN